VAGSALDVSRRGNCRAGFLFPSPEAAADVSIRAVRVIGPLPLCSLLALAGVGLAGCGTAPVPGEPSARPVQDAVPAPEPTPPPLDVFSGERAWSDLEALASSPRVSGTGGSARAREYLTRELSGLGLETAEITTTRHVEGLPDVTLRHVSARLPGESPRLFLLVAAYDSSRFPDFDFLGVNDGASGAALLLELARVLSTRDLPYTVELLFLDGEGRADGLEGPGAARWHGSNTVAAQMAEAGTLDDVRMLVAFHRVCDTDLQIARDLSSHRMHREEFFKAARGVGRPDAFPTDLGFESPTTSHTAFRERGVRTAVAITDTRYGGDGVPGAWSESPEDTLEHCSPESLATVGLVTLDALDTIGRRLEKIERFTRSPLSEVPEEGPLPGEESLQATGGGRDPDALDPADPSVDSDTRRSTETAGEPPPAP
jgi:hypothetical protein